MQRRFQRLKEVISEAGFSADSEVYSLKESGSDCRFYRVKDNKRSVILVFIDGKHKDFDSYIEISDFLRKIGVGVPEIYYHNSKNKAIIEEDLGDLTLQSYIHETADFDIYKKVIDELLLMQVMGGKNIYECECLNNRVFDYNVFRWETWYFVRYFLEMYCGIRIGNRLELEREFHTLALKLVNEPLYFMHRDFQSNNILIKDGKVRVVDFQGAHRGLLAYDLASILRGACVKLPVEVQEKLIDYYLYSLSSRWDITLDNSHFRSIFLYTGLQRNMQALGAFAYLSTVQNKPQFSQYIPRTVEYLYKGLEQAHEFPELLAIIETVKSCLELH